MITFLAQKSSTYKRPDYSLPRLSFVSHHLFSWPEGFSGWCYCCRRAFLECIQNEPSKQRKQNHHFDTAHTSQTNSIFVANFQIEFMLETVILNRDETPISMGPVIGTQLVRWKWCIVQTVYTWYKKWCTGTTRGTVV